MRASLCFVAIAGCGASSSRPAPIDNRDHHDAVGCPPALAPFDKAEPVTAADECAHGAPSPWFVGSSDWPSCHAYQVTGPTSADETVRLADGRQIWLRQDGCAHATFWLRGDLPAPIDRRDRAAVMRAGAALLHAIAPVAPEVNLDHDAEEIEAAAATAPTGSFPLGYGDNWATVETISDATIEVSVDFPL